MVCSLPDFRPVVATRNREPFLDPIRPPLARCIQTCSFIIVQNRAVGTLMMSPSDLQLQGVLIGSTSGGPPGAVGVPNDPG